MGTFKPQHHHRRSIRLAGYDYSQSGAYFVTLCTHQRESLFGEVIDGEMNLNTYGQIAYNEWVQSSHIRRKIVLDTFVVMPNHMHGIVWIVANSDESETHDVGAHNVEAHGLGSHGTHNVVGAHGRASLLGGTKPQSVIRTHGVDNVGAHSRVLTHGDTSPPGLTPKSLGSFISGFKSSVTKQINQLRTMPGVPVWQRNYYEHIIRHDDALYAIRYYIQQNPLRWHLDRYNPQATNHDPHAKALWDLLKG